MQNKIILTINALLIAWATLPCCFSQNNSLSSTSGIGHRSSNDHPVFSGMGGHSVSYASSNVLNTYNPASYSFLNYQYPIFSIGVVSQSSTVKENDREESHSNTTLSDLAFGMSFAKRLGLVFGFKPLYETNYSFSQASSMSSTAVRYQYQGSGVLNKGYVGFSVKVINKNAIQWVLGTNVGSVFGRTEHFRKSSLLNGSNNVGGVESSVYQARSFHYDLGTLIKWKLTTNQELTLGINFEPEQAIRSTYNRTLYYAIDIDDPNLWGNPLNELGEKKGRSIVPQHYQIGVAYAKNFRDHKKNNDYRLSQLLISVEYSQAAWSKYEERYLDSAFVYGFKDATGFQAGLQYIPQTSHLGNAMPKLFERTNYRIGFYKTTLPYLHNNDSQFSQWALSIGLGIPLLIERRLDSSFQLSVAAGKRNNTAINSISSEFVTVGLGFFITPSFNDRWFIKRKLD